MNLWDVLQRNAADQPDSVAYHVYQHGGDPAGVSVGYAPLQERAAALAARLRPGQVVGLLNIPPSLDYIVGLYACFAAGAVAVPIAPPLSAEQWQTTTSIVRDAECDVVLVDELILDHVRTNLPQHLVTTVAALQAADDTLPPHAAGPPAGTALLQFTSGTTSRPKGVVISHDNLMANLTAINRAFGHTTDSVGVIWLPQYHDMGLIGGILAPMSAAFPVHLMSPLAFLANPSSWLRMISDQRATISGGPNFAYDLAVRRSSPESLAGLDLRSWSVAFNGAESIFHGTLTRFAETFAGAGFDPHSFLTCYGLAEATLIVTGTGLHDLPRVSNDRAGEPVVGSGRAVAGEVRVVDPDTGHECAPREVGEIWVSGPCVASGYWRRPEASAETFGASLAGDDRAWLRTGDVGSLDEHGELIVLGRTKEVLVVRGENLSPAQVERAASEAHAVLRPGCAAAFATPGVDGAGYCVVVETRSSELDEDTLRAAAQAVRTACVAAVGIRPALVVVTSRDAVAKTTSGKTRRLQAQQDLAAGQLTELFRLDERDAEPRPTPAQSSAASVLALVERAVGRPLSGADRDREWAALGLGSLELVALVEAVNAGFGLQVRPTELFDVSTPAALIDYLAASGSQPVPAGAARQPVAATALPLVGMACRFPGGDGVEAFWQTLCAGRPTAEAVQRRWPAADLSRLRRDPSGHKGASASFLGAPAGFDADFFGISRAEAIAMDPQQRWLLECAWHALEDAGLHPDALGGEQVGVFVGVSSTDYGVVSRGGRVGPYAAVGASASAVAGRLAYTLRANGPCLAVDTACASSLSALHEAVRSLRAGDCTVAIVAGVNALLDYDVTVALSRLGALSARGICAWADDRADGYVRGEGVGVVVLATAATAQALHLAPRAYVAGTATNHNGRSNGLTAPSAGAQRAVLTAALADAGVRPADVGYLEVHGTGTTLGDPLEIEAAAEVYGPREQPLLAGSAKTVVGHLEAAAGVVGLIKSVLVLERGAVPPSGPIESPNRHVDWDRVALRPVTEPTRWDGRGRYAAVSSFGFTGSNVHAVLAAAEVAAPAAPTEAPLVLPLCGRDEPGLRTALRELRTVLAAGAVSPRDLAWTAATRRRHLAQRVALQGHDRPDQLAVWAAEIDALLAGEAPAGRRARDPAGLSVEARGDGVLTPWWPAVDGLLAGGGPPVEVELRAADGTVLERSRLHDAPGALAWLACVYTAGVELDWATLRCFAGDAPRVARLPGTVFRHETYWYEERIPQ